MPLEVNSQGRNAYKKLVPFSLVLIPVSQLTQDLSSKALLNGVSVLQTGRHSAGLRISRIRAELSLSLNHRWPLHPAKDVCVPCKEDLNLFCNIPVLQVSVFSVQKREERNTPRLHIAMESRLPSEA